MSRGRLGLILGIFLLSVVILIFLSIVMINALPLLRMEGVLAIMGILATVLFKIPDLLNWLNKGPAVPEERQPAGPSNPAKQAEPPAHVMATADNQGSSLTSLPAPDVWDLMKQDDHATLTLIHRNRLVNMEFNPPPLSVTNQPLAGLMNGIQEILEDPIDPRAVMGMGNRLFRLFFPSQDTVQIDTSTGDLFVYYPLFPEELGKIPYELIRKWGSQWGVLRLPNGNPTEIHAATLRRVLSAFHPPAKFRLLIVVYIHQKWEDVDRALKEWLVCLPDNVEPEVYLDKRATPTRVKNLIAGGGYDGIYFIAHHHGGKLDLYGRGAQGKLDLKDLTIKDNPLIFLNACEAANIDSMAVNELLESGAGFVVGTLGKIDAVEAIRFGGLFFEALFGCSTYHTYLNSTEHFGLDLPDRSLPAARALSWARKCFETRSGIGWSYVLFGQPDIGKLEKLFQATAEDLRRHRLWKAFVEVQGCIQSEAKMRPVVSTEIEKSLNAEDWETIEAMLELPLPYREDLSEGVQKWIEKMFEKREWQAVIERAKILEELGSDAADRAGKAAQADQWVMEVKQNLKI